MAHVRAQIIAALAATLTGLTTTAARVHVARPADWPLSQTELPALLIYADSEVLRTTEIMGWPRRMERDIEIRVECLAQDDGTIEATLAAMLSEIEAAIGASRSSSGCGTLLIQPLTLTAVDVARDSDGERIVGRLSTIWTGTYYTYSNAPDTAVT